MRALPLFLFILLFTSLSFVAEAQETRGLASTPTVTVTSGQGSADAELAACKDKCKSEIQGDTKLYEECLNSNCKITPVGVDSVVGVTTPANPPSGIFGIISGIFGNILGGKTTTTTLNDGKTLANCTDSDGGMDKYTPGTARDGRDVKQDHCEGVGGSQKNLVEAYCSHDGKATYVTIHCSGSCYNGKCNDATDEENDAGDNASNVTCTDSDGSDRYTRGSATNGQKRLNDVCRSNNDGTRYVDEAYCWRGVPLYTPYICSAGCLDGACNRPSNGQQEPDENDTCTDSDGGMDKYTPGTARDGRDVKQDFCEFGGGQNRNLNEAYCSHDGKATYVTIRCSGACYNGKCSDKKDTDSDSSEQESEKCSDSDGDDKYTKGVAKDAKNTLNDACSGYGNTSSVRESICSQGKAVYVLIPCHAQCYNGVCARPKGSEEGDVPSSEKTCTDSDGSDRYTGGSATNGQTTLRDVCRPNNDGTRYVDEAICSQGTPRYIQMTCSAGCLDGACNRPSNGHEPDENTNSKGGGIFEWLKSLFGMAGKETTTTTTQREGKFPSPEIEITTTTFVPTTTSLRFPSVTTTLTLRAPSNTSTTTLPMQTTTTLPKPTISNASNTACSSTDGNNKEIKGTSKGKLFGDTTDDEGNEKTFNDYGVFTDRCVGGRIQEFYCSDGLVDFYYDVKIFFRQRFSAENG
ncbi:MAG: hypothetical protein HZB68_01545 [Candidatus Aenigmarchaeota archaeon]|nr:hypothetical protein [Candidatus Aenigmarchaeota archaeon]